MMAGREDPLPAITEVVCGGMCLAFEIGVAAQAVFESLEHGKAVAGRQASGTHGAFGRGAQVVQDAAGVVFHIAQMCIRDSPDLP